MLGKFWPTAQRVSKVIFLQRKFIRRYRMNFKLLVDHLSPAENETQVKAYHCTSFKSGILNMKAEGYLAVTNKRVVFHAFGSSFAGKSILQSEIPIEDVSGISIYKGTYFSFWHLVGAFFASNAIAGMIAAVVVGLFAILLQLLTNNIGGSDLSNIFNNLQSLQGNADKIILLLKTTMFIAKVVIFVVGLLLLLASTIIAKQNIWRSIIASLATMSFGLLGSFNVITGFINDFGANIANGMGNVSQSNILSGWPYLVAFISGIYALICYFWYSRRPTMSLSVGSKGGSSTPIAISGISNFGIYTTAASRALSAEPAEDAENLVKEIGAIVLDIQTMGDFGSKKWQSA